MTGWLVADRAKPGAAGRLYVFPHAGGTASSFRSWPGMAGDRLEVVRVQYPGREGRFREAAYRRVDSLAAPIADEVAAADVRPYALLGHSMGALVALEVAHRLVAIGDPPDRLVVSAALPPHRLGPRRRYSELPAGELLGLLCAIDGSGAHLLADPDVADALLPTVRADLAAVETYRYRRRPPLPCPITALYGTDDLPIHEDQLAAWADLTAGGFDSHDFPGGHFFLWAAAGDVIANIQHALCGTGQR